MTNLDTLYKAVNENDQQSLFKWFEDYALWFDPGGHWDEMETIEYLKLESKYKKEKINDRDRRNETLCS